MAKIVVALGGNAILRPGQRGTYAEQLENVKLTADSIVKLIEAGHTVILTHGNGPQVGTVLIQQESAAEKVPPQPLDVCGAMTQGQIGYMVQNSLDNALRKHGVRRSVVPLVTRSLVDSADPAFTNPTKPVGPFFSEEHAKERMATGESWIEDSGRGWRRVVPSPVPVHILEKEMIKAILNSGGIVIAAGGGGIPVVEKDGELVGVEATIDKDLGAYRLALDLEADMLVILTDVEKVAINFGTPNQVNLGELTIEQAQKHLEDGEFGTGSMAPKVTAAINFVKAGGQRAIITSLDNALNAVAGNGGTVFTRVNLY